MYDVYIVNDGIATDCKFKFTTYDAKRYLWNGEFTINFSEGELSGKVRKCSVTTK